LCATLSRRVQKQYLGLDRPADSFLVSNLRPNRLIRYRDHHCRLKGFFLSKTGVIAPLVIKRAAASLIRAPRPSGKKCSGGSQ
jgi:hypothetical protein